MKGNLFIKILLIAGCILTVVGGVIFAVAMTKNGWNFSSLSNQVVERKTIEIVEEDQLGQIDEISVVLLTSDVKFAYHDEQKITVSCYDLKSSKGEILEKVNVQTNGNVLEIKREKVKVQTFQIGVINNTDVVVKLPKDKAVKIAVDVTTGDVIIGEKSNDYVFTDIDLKTTTGQIKFNGNVNCNRVKLSLTTGDTYINGKLTAKTFEKECTTGDLDVNATVIISGRMQINHVTGDIECDAFITAGEIYIETNTGDVELNLLGSKSDYTYVYESSTGDSNERPFANGEKRIEIIISTGDVDLHFEQ